MTYDFDTIFNRRHSDSLKWNVGDDVLPMWVADMDFPTAPCVQKALEKRIAHGIFGYTEVPDAWHEAYQSFFLDRHDFTIEKEDLIFSLGVVPTISSSVRKLTKVGDNVVVLPPVYNIFYNSIVNNQRNVLEVPLLRDGLTYSIDFENLEKAFQDEKTSLLIFCNPHNPVGRIWSKEELDKVGQLAYKYHVTVLSDEIHSQLVRPGKSYVPFLAANKINKEITVMAVSPTKAFNLAGIQTSAIVIKNPQLRALVNRQLNTDEVAEPNILSCVAAINALNDGREWLDQLRVYLFENRDLVEKTLAKELPEVTVIPGDATYLIWIDISKITSDSKAFCKYLKEEEKLFVSTGDSYGQGGQGFIRLNVACPKRTLEEGLRRLIKGFKNYH